MAERMLDRRVLPPSIADDRGRAVLSLWGKVSGSFDWRRDLAVTWADVPTAMLPYAVRSLALQNLVQPGMREEVVRRFIANAWPLHALQGKVAGVRFGLSLLGMQVDWRQWYLQTPQGAPGTYVATVTVDQEVFAGEGTAVTVRLQRTALGMIDYMKRWSQDGAVRFHVESRVPVYVGAVVRSRIHIRPSTDPVSRVSAMPPVFVGAVVRSRLRIQPTVT